MNNNKWVFVFLFASIALFILWQMLLPGYVLTLDAIFAPGMKIDFSLSTYANSWPIFFLIDFFPAAIPIWLAEKIIIFLIFFFIGYAAFRFLPLPRNKIVRLFSSLVYLLNPFVYERFLAGDWFLLAAYSLLPVLVCSLFAFIAHPIFVNGLKMFFVLYLIGIFSLHFLVIGVILVVASIICHLIWRLLVKDFFYVATAAKNFFFSVIVFLALSAYWFIPAVFFQQWRAGSFGSQHWSAFAASGRGSIGTVLNLLSLNGFWGEGQPWAKQFFWPQDSPLFWLTSVAIAIFVLIGLVAGLSEKKTRSSVLFFLLLGVISFALAAGAGDVYWCGLNFWFYRHIPLWSGFRDSQKFCGWLALSYAALAGYGAVFVSEKICRAKNILNIFLAILFLAIPVLWGWLFWFGFHGQLKSVQYPDSWLAARKIIDQDKSANKVLFLPWHGYFSLAFNNNFLTANPAKIFFGEKAIVGRSVELGEIYDQENSSDYRLTDDVVTGKKAMSGGSVIDFLKKEGVTYIVFSTDLAGVDNLNYDFLNYPKLEKIIDSPRLFLYQLK
jgi:hypothetical protein